LLIVAKYGLRLAEKRVFLYVPSYNFQAMGFLTANQSAVFDHDHQTTELGFTGGGVKGEG
jgi:hypothetical protein